MATHIELAIGLLRSSGAFYRSIGEHNEELKDQMMENASAMEAVADLLEKDPMGAVEGDEALLGSGGVGQEPIPE